MHICVYALIVTYMDCRQGHVEWTNHHFDFGGVMVTVINLSPVDYGLEPRFAKLVFVAFLLCTQQ